MKEMVKLYRLFNILSLDVALGAVVGSLFFAKIYAVLPSVTSLISLGLTVWIIYTADRLLDVRDIMGVASSARHRFHQRNKKVLFYSLLLSVIVDAVLVFFMPAIVIKYGVLLSLMVVIYIILRKRLHISKELLVAVLYTAGVILPVFPLVQRGIDTHVPLVLFFLIALINLILFSFYEKESDVKDNQNSVATLVGERAIRQTLISLFIITISITSHLFFILAYHFIAIIFLGMITLLFIVFLFERNLTKYDYYRLLGDAIFLLPIIYVIA